jgi:serine phosphatase RsbU (regulator of sigma subunit)
LPGYAFFDYYEPANQVGGDYYDYIQLRDGRVAVVVADVVGHGIAAALLMAKLSAEARYCLASQPTAAKALTELNRRFCGPRTDRFVTIVMAIIDPEKHEVTIVNGGHMAPIWLRSNGAILDVGEDIASLPIGIMDDIVYEQTVIQFGLGDTLTLYTDGLNESMDAEDLEFGIERIREVIMKNCGDVEKVGKQLVNEVRRHIGTAPQYDDMCLVCFGRCRSPADTN